MCVLVLKFEITGLGDRSQLKRKLSCSKSKGERMRNPEEHKRDFAESGSHKKFWFMSWVISTLLVTIDFGGCHWIQFNTMSTLLAEQTS